MGPGHIGWKFIANFARGFLFACLEHLSSERLGQDANHGTSLVVDLRKLLIHSTHVRLVVSPLFLEISSGQFGDMLDSLSGFKECAD